MGDPRASYEISTTAIEVKKKHETEKTHSNPPKMTNHNPTLFFNPNWRKDMFKPEKIQEIIIYRAKL